MKVKLLSHVRFLATPWTAAYQAPPSMGFSRQEYWSGLPLPSLELVILVPGKIDFKLKIITSDKGGYLIMIKSVHLSKRYMIVYINVPSNKIPQNT